MKNPTIKKIGIIGYGVVGQHVHATFSAKFETGIFDPAKGYDDTAALNGASAVFVCVPTPMLPDGDADIGMVAEAVERIQPRDGGPLIVIKSTVPPGTTDALALKYGKAVHFSPEHLVERDPRESPAEFLIVGGPQADAVIDLHQEVMPSSAQMLACSNVEAELAKYMANCWFATKVTFCNEFAGISAAMGVSYHRLRELWLADPRIERDHTAVFRDQPGYGGKCLPKDIAAMIAAARTWVYRAEFLSAVVEANERFRQGIA